MRQPFWSSSSCVLRGGGRVKGVGWGAPKDYLSGLSLFSNCLLDAKLHFVGSTPRQTQQGRDIIQERGWGKDRHLHQARGILQRGGGGDGTAT